MKMLLHTCCCPCFSSVFEQLNQSENSYDITSYFCNPNIAPLGEYERRLGEVKNYAKIPVVEGSKEPIELPNTKEGGERCRLCIKHRLEDTAKYASKNNYDVFATTLTVSPHKNHEMINEIGEALAKKYNTKYLESNFKKNNGYLRSLELSRENNLYRQNYCGCSPR
ncbi:epoxyqueuosine reductase QueH [Treponema sp. R6D11]